MANPNAPEQPINIIKRDPDQNKQRGTGFTNINRILGANVGAGGIMGDRIGQRIGGLGSDFRSRLGEAQENFQNKFSQGSLEAKNAVEKALRFGRLNDETDEQYENRVAGILGGFNSDEFGKNLAGATYKGPLALENEQALASQAKNVEGTGALARDNLGQGILLRNFVAKPGAYSRAMQGLDQTLLGQDADAQRNLQQVRRNVAGLGAKTMQQIGGARNLAQQTQSGIASNKAEAQRQIASEIQGLANRGTEAATKFGEEGTKLSDTINALLAGKRKSSDLTDEEKQLITNMANYGVDEGAVYTDEDFASGLKGDLSNYFANIASNPGGVKLTDQQKQVLRGLAGINQDEAAKELSQRTFNTDLFNQDIDETLAQNKQFYDDRQRAFQDALKDVEQFKNAAVEMYPLVANKEMGGFDSRNDLFYKGTEDNRERYGDFAKYRSKYQQGYNPDQRATDAFLRGHARSGLEFVGLRDLYRNDPNLNIFNNISNEVSQEQQRRAAMQTTLENYIRQLAGLEAINSGGTV